MWWTIFAIVVAMIGLVPRSRLPKPWGLSVLGCLLLGIIVAPIGSYFEAVKTEETIATLQAHLNIAEEKLVENDSMRKGIIEHAGMAKLNADGLTGLAGEGLTEKSRITPNPELIWLYSGENGDNRAPKCDKEGMEAARQMVKEHPRFPFSYFVLAVCHRRVNGDREWIAYAQQALDILEFTTQVPGHNGHHAVAKGRLDDLMREAKHVLQDQQ